MSVCACVCMCGCMCVGVSESMLSFFFCFFFILFNFSYLSKNAKKQRGVTVTPLRFFAFFFENVTVFGI